MLNKEDYWIHIETSQDVYHILASTVVAIRAHKNSPRMFEVVTTWGRIPVIADSIEAVHERLIKVAV
jgi:hypothetical protein